MKTLRPPKRGDLVGITMTKGIWLVIFLVAAALAPAACWAVKSDQVVRIAAENSWPPFSGRRGLGLSQKIASEAFAVTGYRLDLIVVPYARALRLVDQGEVDGCWNVTRQANTEERFHFGTEPLLQADVSFIYRANNVYDFTTIADIPTGTKIGVIIGYEYGDEFELHKDRFQITSVPSQKSLLYMLSAGRFDMVLMFDEVFAFKLAELKLKPAGYVKGNNFYRSDIFIAFNASSPRSHILSQALDKGLQYLHKTGRYAEIMHSAM